MRPWFRILPALTFPNLAHALICSVLVSHFPGSHLGTEISPGVFFLGEGVTSKVYRIVSPSSSHVEKVYDLTSAIGNDLDAANFLKEQLAHLNDWTVATYKKDPERPDVTLVSDFKGLDFETYIKRFDEQASVDIKKSLITAYNSQVREASNQLRSHPNHHYEILQYNERFDANHILVLEVTIENIRTGKLAGILLKPSGVLVTPEGRLAIIDPK